MEVILLQNSIIETHRYRAGDRVEVKDELLVKELVELKLAYVPEPIQTKTAIQVEDTAEAAASKPATKSRAKK